MKISRILYPVRVLGPGNRIGIWVCGCKRGCAGCANPELWYQDPKNELNMDAVFGLLDPLFSKHAVDGVTISGGEPFLQTKELAELVRYIRHYTDDILIYTGYERNTLLKRKREAEATTYILDNIAVLVDGKYIRERNENHPLKGSENQRIYYKDEAAKANYENYIADRRGKPEVQNFQSAEGLISVGIHRKDFNEQFGCYEGLAAMCRKRGKDGKTI